MLRPRRCAVVLTLAALTATVPLTTSSAAPAPRVEQSNKITWTDPKNDVDSEHNRLGTKAHRQMADIRNVKATDKRGLVVVIKLSKVVRPSESNQIDLAVAFAGLAEDVDGGDDMRMLAVATTAPGGTSEITYDGYGMDCYPEGSPQEPSLTVSPGSRTVTMTVPPGCMFAARQTSHMSAAVAVFYRGKMVGVDDVPTTRRGVALAGS